MFYDQLGEQYEHIKSVISYCSNLNGSILKTLNIELIHSKYWETKYIEQMKTEDFA